jgi:glutamate synthase (ferredoxin)
LDEDTIKLAFVGSAGQSFGAFIPKGLTLELEGDANDSVGKGLSGGKISIYPPREAGFTASENIIIGNVGLFGATSGEAYISGIAGERFCVRNSGADVVVEGVGNHGCEYMTGGRVLVLGKVGRNFAAGMSGGVAYVMDLNKDYCNTQLVNLEKLTDPHEQEEVKHLLEKHVINTGSNLGEVFLNNWETSLKHITKVIPKTYEEMQGYIKQALAQGHTMEEAQIIAYNRKYAV